MIKRLPFYFSPDAVGGDSQQNNGQPNNSISEGQNEPQNASETPKTYTQEEVNALLAKEKRQGKNSVLNALGIKTVEEAKNALNAAKAAADANKTEEQLAADALNAAKKAQTDAENDLLAAKRTISVMKAGFNPQYVDDVVAIASKKVTDDKSFETVIEEMKNTHKFYLTVESTPAEGTGSATAGFKKGGNVQEESYGAKLAKKNSETIKKANEPVFFK